MTQAADNAKESTCKLERSPKISSASDAGVGILTQDGALYLGSTLDTTTHTAHAFKIYIAIHGEFDLLMGPHRLESLTSVVIAPDHPHKVVALNAIVAVFYLVPETVDGQKISKFYYDLHVLIPPRHAVASLASQLNRVWEQGCCREEAGLLSSAICEEILPTPDLNVNFDPRVTFALKYLGTELDHRVSIPELCSAVSLSPSRLEHLFSEQIGISISRYSLWIRLHKALEMITLGVSLTEVAHAVGFADSAHLSRTFRRLIGVAPSTLVKKIELHFVSR